MTDFEPASRRPFELTVLGQVRSYSDEQVLDRAWSRLEKRSHRASSIRPAARLLAAAALLATGFAFGRLTESSETFESSDQLAAEALASNELIAVAEVPAGPALDARQARRVVRRTGSAAGAELAFDGTRLNTSAARERAVAQAGVARGSMRGSASAADLLDEEFASESPFETVVEETAIQPARPAWLVFADRGDFAGAFQLLDESGGFDSVLLAGSAEELMTLVDVARYVGNQGRAIQALRVVTERHQNDANAPLAAMMLGNLLSRAGDQAGASAAFALNRRLSPGGDFAEDALVREFDMAIAAFDLPTVLRLSSQYEQEFPQGRHLKELRSEVARLRQAVAVRESAAADQVAVPSQSVVEKHAVSEKQSAENHPAEKPSTEPESAQRDEADSKSNGSPAKNAD